MQGFDFGVDEWLALCQHFKRLSDKYPDDWEDPNMSEDSDNDESVRKLALHVIEHHPAPFLVPLIGSFKGELRF